MEKFAVDLDAVLDEFELNEDQAEVAAARLQKQIEQGRLEIVSSDTTPGSSYANSPRSSFAHLHEEPGRTVSPLARPADGSERVTRSLTTAYHRSPSDQPTSDRLSAKAATHHSSLVDVITSDDQSSAAPSNHCTAPSYAVASEPMPDVVAATGAFPSASSSAGSAGLTTPYPLSPVAISVNSGTLSASDSVPNSASAATDSDGDTVAVISSDRLLSPGQLSTTSTESDQSAADNAAEQLGSPGQSEGTVATRPAEDKCAVLTGGLEAGERSAEEPISRTVAAEVASSPEPRRQPVAVVATEKVARDIQSDTVRGPGRSDTIQRTADTAPPTPVPGETPRQLQAAPDPDATVADTAGRQPDLDDGVDAETQSSGDCAVETQLSGDGSVETQLSGDGGIETQLPGDVGIETQLSDNGDAETQLSDNCAAETQLCDDCGDETQLYGDGAARDIEPAPTERSPASLDGISAPEWAGSPAREPAETAAPVGPSSPLARKPSAQSDPAMADLPHPDQQQEPVRFQPADDVSDSELETYLERLEDSAADTTPDEPPADEPFGGARPKTSAAAAEQLEPAGAPLQPLKGGVISRLQSQVSIECEVDSRSGRPPVPAETGRGSLPPAPVRPSSLDLTSRSQSIAEQPEGDSVPERATDDPVSSPGAAPTPADGEPAQESVSTTGGNIVTAPGAYEEARLAAGRLAPTAAPAPAPAAATAAHGQLVSLSDEDKNLGKVAPVWVPDEDAVACMECELRFTVIRRRHHCRACGRLLCSACCSERASLDYMELREGRVCGRCKRTIDRVQQESRVVSAGGAHHQMARPPNPNNPMEYCSTVPPSEQASHDTPPPTVMVPSGVLKRAETSGGRTPSREAKQVMFSDGIRPGGDLTEPARPAGTEPELRRPPHRRTARIARAAHRSPAAILKDAKGCKDLCWKPESGKLPPIYQSGSAGASVKQSTPEETIVSMIRAERDLPWSFLINKNLMVVVKMFKLDCCVGRTCWIFTSHGLSTVGQEEVVVILESLPDEATLPKDIFFFYHHLFAEAAKGHFVTELGNTLFSAPFLGSKEHGGFLYLRPTFQCLHNVPAPPQPFLVAVLIQKWEAPWAKVFPLRLLLRLGAEFRYYPCPLVSVRHRKPVFFEVGHTIINLLADFRNFAYVLPTVHGMHIHMEEQETSVLIPRNRFNQVLKAINNSNDHVLALGASFSREADSHLVCMQNEDGQYQTQAINIQNRPRQVTGASFVVFNGALKSAAGLTAKSSIVEDGLMFQVSPDTMQTLRASLRQMQDYRIECGPVGQPPDELINIRWVEDDRSHNLGVRSVIDDKPLDGIPSIRVHSGTDYVADSKLIRWTEVYLIKVSESVARSGSEPPDFSRLAEDVARGTCVALTPHLPLLADSERTRIGLRATVDRDTVGYEAGSNGEPLPPSCMNLLDSELVPVLHRFAAEVPDTPSCLELLFHVIDR